MKNVLFIFIALLNIINIYSQNIDNKKNTKEYINEVFRFKVNIPENWSLYGQIKNDSVKQKSIVDWGIPPVYSEIEKTMIENSISITAYNRSNISSLDELILSEYLRIDPTKTALESDSTTTADSRIVYTTINGLNYKGKSYFVYKNNIGYVINFMATTGTFDINILIFEEFYKSIIYF